jgi:hypothetical protein
MRELDKISAALFDKIRARFDHVNIGDENAQRVTDPEKARFLNFDYISEDGENFGNVTISLIDEDSLKIYFGANITEALDEEQETEWYKFLRGLREFARRNMLNFDVRDINRSNLDLKDIKQQSVSDATYDKEELAIAEGRLYGHGNNRRVSFGDVGEHKLIIKHRDQIDPERHGARARQIEHVFIETPVGERFLLDHTNLHGARATANHLRHGGNIGDEGSQLINEMVKEMASMRHFVRSMKNRTFEDAETSGMVEAAIYRYNEVKNNLKRFQGRKGHELLIDMCDRRYNDMDETVDVDSLRERFVKKIYDDRFNEALPYVYRAYKNKQKMDTPMTVEFESWANEITEQTWDEDNDDRDEQDLTVLMQTPIAVGVDASDGIAAISNINFLQDDELKQALLKLSQVQGPDADARRTIVGWLAANGETALANQFMQVLQQQNTNTQPAPQQPVPPPQPVGATTMDQPVVQEDLGFLRKLAGLVKK